MTFFNKGCVRRVYQLQRQSITTVRLVSYINSKTRKNAVYRIGNSLSNHQSVIDKKSFDIKIEKDKSHLQH